MDLRQSNTGADSGRHDHHAFTLVELLVVITTIALLLALLMPALGDRQVRGMVWCADPTSASSSWRVSAPCRRTRRLLRAGGQGHAGRRPDGIVGTVCGPLSRNPSTLQRDRWQAIWPRAGSKECPIHVNFVRSSDWSANFEQGCELRLQYGLSGQPPVGPRPQSGVGCPAGLRADDPRQRSGQPCGRRSCSQTPRWPTTASHSSSTLLPNLLSRSSAVRS